MKYSDPSYGLKIPIIGFYCLEESEWSASINYTSLFLEGQISEEDRTFI